MNIIIKAINLGNSKAAYKLGSLYEIGIEGYLLPDMEKAIEYYIKATDLGNSKAAKHLGMLYNNGKEI